MKQYFVLYDKWDDFELHWIQAYKIFSIYEEACLFMENLKDSKNRKNAVGPLVLMDESIDKLKN